ncbi:hypothetical protein TBLA_0F00970 [Henningerozyma blattae CBS 6284]|uniref:Phosphatidylglycerol/phosphatidylinositol transfer protein n=1 Tax=Henningerozyma blattae (strain ATCC 34711 / CBS 6284 / DSM 70876 / NBRC 10599 / NRRL Y-10934 / UCD 77-7) TaxID=1071380 RepID=I2H5I8_HENB6|nr:hypothetical protein TBLA_0F00970 [Tetrapisispora blattae CBS 6284]CCH61640.1 hypothetical protein TBLA_0F00970 [Tetrapisispora blattae CBS 6284]
MLKCDKNDPQILSISSLIIAPNPPKRGSTMILEAEGDIISEISEGAYVDVEVRLGYIKLLTQRLDLCAILADHARDQPDMQCPVQPGHHTFAQKVDIPNEVPAGRYVVVARAFTKDDELITCLTGTIVFKPLF